MKPREVFNLIVRVLGLWFVYLAITALPTVFSMPLPILVIKTVLTVLFYAGVGWWLLGGAPLLVGRAYPATNGGDHQAGCQARVQ